MKSTESAIVAVADFLVRFTIGFIAMIVQASIRWPMFGLLILCLIVLDVLSHHPIALGITAAVILLVWLMTRSNAAEQTTNPAED